MFMTILVKKNTSMRSKRVLKMCSIYINREFLLLNKKSLLNEAGNYKRSKSHCIIFLFLLQLPQFEEDRGNTASLHQRIWYSNQSLTILHNPLPKEEFKGLPSLMCHSLLKTDQWAPFHSHIIMTYICCIGMWQKRKEAFMLWR